MAFKVPKITIDPTALRHGIWGNTWKQWGWIALAFLGLYAVLTGYLTGMLFAAKGIRQDNFRTMSGKFFGDFDRTLFTASIPYFPSPRFGAVKDPNYFNRPDGCEQKMDPTPLPGFPTEIVNKPTGILSCNNNDQWRWTVYPWVKDTNGLGQYPGCANPLGTPKTLYSYLSRATSPAAEDAGEATPEMQEQWVCQNDVAVAAQ